VSPTSARSANQPKVVFHAASGVRHTHPGLAPLENPQCPAFGQAQAPEVLEFATWLDAELQRQPWVAGERFTIADITALCPLEFARLMRFKADRAGLTALQAWLDRMAERPSGAACSSRPKTPSLNKNAPSAPCPS
jgi:glutathione S-transferase